MSSLADQLIAANAATVPPAPTQSDPNDPAVIAQEIAARHPELCVLQNGAIAPSTSPNHFYAENKDNLYRLLGRTHSFSRGLDILVWEALRNNLPAFDYGAIRIGEDAIWDKRTQRILSVDAYMELYGIMRYRRK